MLAERIRDLVYQSGRRLRANGLAATVIAAIYERRAALSQSLFESVKHEDPDFRRAATAQFSTEAVSHALRHVDTVMAIAGGRGEQLGPDPFAFVRSQAVLRARQQLPLTAGLHAYRLGHRVRMQQMRDMVMERAQSQEEAVAALIVLSDFMTEYHDLISTIFTDTYLAEEQLTSLQRSRLRTTVVEDLLRGIRPRDTPAQQLCDYCGLRFAMPMTVVVARPALTDPGERIDFGAELALLWRLIDRALPAPEMGKLVHIWGNDVVAIVCRESDPARSIAETLRRSLLEMSNGALAYAGVGLDASEIDQLPRAYAEAQRSVEFALPSRPIVHFAEVDLLEFLTRHPDTMALRLIPAWAEAFIEADRHKGGELLRTICAFAECDLNVKLTARHLGLHANTLYFRLNRIKALTGIDPRRFSGVSLLLTASRLLETRAKTVNGASRA